DGPKHLPVRGPEARLEVQKRLPRFERERRGLAVSGDADGLHVPVPIQLGAEDDASAAGRIAHPKLASEKRRRLVHRSGTDSPRRLRDSHHAPRSSTTRPSIPPLRMRANTSLTFSRVSVETVARTLPCAA